MVGEKTDRHFAFHLHYQKLKNEDRGRIFTAGLKRRKSGKHRRRNILA